jgi:hypothetical protein
VVVLIKLEFSGFYAGYLGEGRLKLSRRGENDSRTT